MHVAPEHLFRAHQITAEIEWLCAQAARRRAERHWSSARGAALSPAEVEDYARLVRDISEQARQLFALMAEADLVAGRAAVRPILVDSIEERLRQTADT